MNVRIARLFFSVCLAACGSSPKHVAPVVVRAAPKPSIAPAGKPSEAIQAPPDIVDVEAPKGACVVAGRSFDGFDLSGTADGPSLLHVGPGDAKLFVAKQVTFAEVVTPTVTLRGFVSQNPKLRRAFVYPKKWLSFGGVYFPGIQTQMHVFGEHDGNLVLDAPDLTPLILTEKNRRVEVGCDDVSLAADPASVQRSDLPPEFLPLSTKQMILESAEPIAISAAPQGEAVGEILLAGRSWDHGKAIVDVLDTNGDQTHIRWDHLTGWVATARLSALSPKAVEIAKTMNAPGVEREPGRWLRHDYLRAETTQLICAEDVAVAATSEKDAGWFVMGTIPAGQLVRVTPMNDLFVLVNLDAVSTTAASEGLAETWRPRSFAGTWNAELAHCQGALETATPTALPSVDLASEFISHTILSDTVDALAPQVRRSGAVNPAKRYPDLKPPKRDPWRYIHVGPSVGETAVHTTGPLSSDLVARVTRQSFPEMCRCLSRASQGRPERGEVNLRFEVDRAGHVSSIVDAGSTGYGIEAIGCVAQSISRTLFPPPQTAKEIVDYSMYFGIKTLSQT